MAATQVEKAYCVLELAKTNSVTVVQRYFRTKYGKPPPTRQSIYDWYERFESSGCVCKKKSTGRPSVTEEKIDSVRDVFVRSPGKSTRSASLELQIPQPTVWKILRKRLKMTPYKLQLVQSLNDNDKVVRKNFCQEMQHCLENDDTLFNRLIFSDECTFHISGKVNRHNVRVWGTENPRETVQHIRDSPKVNVFCALSCEKVYGPFFFQEPSVTGRIYLDMLTEWLMPQLHEDSCNFIFVQDGAPPHWYSDVRGYLDEHLPRRWIGRASEENVVFQPWPPRSPDLTPCDFFLWGYVKDRVFVPPLPVDIDDLKQRITNALATVNREMLSRVWSEFDYRVDICRVANGAHIEHL